MKQCESRVSSPKTRHIAYRLVIIFSFYILQAFRKESDASLEDQLKEAAEKTAAMHVTEKKKERERKGSESKDSKKEVSTQG